MGYCIFLRKGEIHTPPSAGILASDLAVGDIVKLTENGTPVEYIVVNQGIPTGGSLYDSSCNGTWLLRKDVHSDMKTARLYTNSSVNTWLNGDFFNSLGAIEQATIKQVKIPYCNSPSSGTVASGVNGLSVKSFILCPYEVGGATYANISASPIDGVKLDYFKNGITTSAKNKRIAYNNGTTTVAGWWTRSPNTETSGIWGISSDGGFAQNISTDRSNGVRPALILPFTAIFDKDTKILKE